MNKKDEFKSLSLKYCVDIARDYTEAEARRFLPTSAQNAWELGSEFIEHELSEDRKKRKDFVL